MNNFTMLISSQKNFLSAALVLLLSSTISFGQTDICPGADTLVSTVGITYAPEYLVIDVGTTVGWVNTGGTHDVNGVASSIEAWAYPNPETFALDTMTVDSVPACLGTHTFTIAGEYTYDCTTYGHASNGMVAYITVMEVEVYGCTEAGASNYDADATVDDGSCCYQLLTLSLDPTDAICFGADGMITATVSDTLDTLTTVTYTLGEESNLTGMFTVLAGNHTVTATVTSTDTTMVMCTTSMDVTVGEGAEILVDASATDETEGALGVGTATATGGAGSYSFVWTDADETEVDASALAAGDYTVTATDSLGCMGTATVTNIFNSIYDIDPLAFGLFPNPTTGAITLQVSNVMKDVKMQVLDATGRVVFTQDALVLQGATTFNFSNLSTGTYTIMISNDNGTSVRRLSIQN